MLVIGDQALGHREGDRGLADTARSDDRQKALSPELISEPANGVVAANQSRQKRRQIMCVLGLGSLRPSDLRLRCAFDRRYEGVAAPRDIDQIPVPAAQ